MGAVGNYSGGLVDIFSGGVDIFSRGIAIFLGGVEIVSGGPGLRFFRRVEIIFGRGYDFFEGGRLRNNY